LTSKASKGSSTKEGVIFEIFYLKGRKRAMGGVWSGERGGGGKAINMEWGESNRETRKTLLKKNVILGGDRGPAGKDQDLGGGGKKGRVEMI